MRAAINRTEHLFMDNDGFVHPITNWFDSDCQECDPDDAVVCVAGSEGRWFTIRLADFKKCAVQ
jgi:hypothetical protein